MKDAKHRKAWWSGTYRFWFWVALTLAAYHLADFFYTGIRDGSFAFEWPLWRHLLDVVVFAGLANYFRSSLQRAYS